MTDFHHELFQPTCWTPGAQRAWQRAAAVTRKRSASETDLHHLFWALLVDEGRAGARMESAGLTLSDLESTDPELATMTLEAIDSETAAIPAASTQVTELLLTLANEALHVARKLDGVDEATTEHLLWAMKHSLSPWADVVAGCFPEVNETERSDDVPESTDAVQVPSEYQVELRERLPLNRAEIFRVIDAAANRSREGLRVVEDFVRFTQNDGFLSRELKQLRHDLQQTLTHFAPEELAAARDTQGDVGVSIETATEYQRNDVYDVLIAAFKRTQEALRTLEEYTKILAGGVAHHFERLRYQSYTIEKAVLQTLRARERLASQLLYVLLTESQCPAGVGHVLRGAYEAGVQMFQIREKSMCDRELVEHCRRIRRWTQEAGALLIINDRPDIAAIVGADGVHVGQEELSVADVRRIVGPNMLIGVSTHAIDQARQAVLDGADYLGVGPTFPTPTKTFESFPGLDYIAEVAAEIELPWFAIGGITPETVPQAKRSGAARIAVSSAVSRAESPVEVCTELLWALQDTVPAPASPSNPSK